MAGKRTAEQQRQYMAAYRARKKLEQQQSAGIDPDAGLDRSVFDSKPGRVAMPDAPVGKVAWRSAEAFAAPPAKDVHAVCRKAERASWQREQDAREDYRVMLGILLVIATAKEQSPGSRRYLVYEDTMSAILAITDDVHERERQAAEFAVDMDEPF